MSEEEELAAHRSGCAVCQSASRFSAACPTAQAIHERYVLAAHVEHHRAHALELPEPLRRAARQAGLRADG